MNRPRRRNPHVVSARLRKAGVHTSTDKKRGGKRGDSRATELERAVKEYLDDQETRTTSES